MANNSKPATPIIEAIHLRVHIHCEGCKKKVKKVLNKVEGVYTVDIDASISKVTITGTADAKTLIKKLEKAHKVVELWPTVEAPPGHGFKGREDVFKGKGEGIMKGKEDVLKGKEGVIKGKEEVVKGKEEVVQQGKVKEVKEEGEAKLLKKQEEPEQKQRQNQKQNQNQNQNQNKKQDPAALQAKQEENAEVNQKKEDDNGAKKAAENGNKRNNNSKRNNASGCKKPNGGDGDANVNNKSMAMDNAIKGMEKKNTSNGGVDVESNLKKAETLVDEPKAKAGGAEEAKSRSDTIPKKGSLPLRPDRAGEGKKPEMVVVEEKGDDGDGVFASSSSNTNSPSHMNKHVAPPPMVLVETSPEYFVSEMGSAEEYATHMFSDENANNVCIVM